MTEAEELIGGLLLLLFYKLVHAGTCRCILYVLHIFYIIGIVIPFHSIYATANKYQRNHGFKNEHIHTISRI